LRDLSNFKPAHFLHASAREDITEAGLSQAGSLLRDHFKEFCSGIPCQVVLDIRNCNIELMKLKAKNFQLSNQR
jgi:hypothetical protein